MTVRTAHIPGLDGLRGIAVIMVLLFHSGLGWLPGGFLGVSIFFTLSGFLITSLLLDEVVATGAVDLRAFWGRRLRRLLPAAVVAIGATVLLAPIFLTAVEESRLRGDAVAGLLYVSNWHYVLADRSYEELFASVSPLLHLWSLSIEAQMYVVVPVVVLLAAKLHLRRRGIGVILVLAFVMSTAISILVTNSDRLYYGTDARAAELLAGAALACFWRPGSGFGRIEARWWRFIAGAASVVAFGAAMLIARFTTTGSAWVYSGALSAFALLSALLVVAVVRPGPLSTMLGWRPLTAVGAISYGLYLYHWPIFVWMTPDRTGVDGVALFAARLAVTGAVTVLSYVVLETPIRRRRMLASAGAARLVTLAALAAVLILPFVALDSVSDEVETGQRVLATVPEVGDLAPGAPQGPDGVLRVVVIGDSTAENIARALADTGDPLLGVISAGVIGCPLVPTAEVFDRPGASQDSTYCPDTVQVVAETSSDVDAVVVVAGVANQWSYRGRDGVVVEVGGDEYRQRLRQWMDRVQEVLAAKGLPVIFFDAPLTRSSDAVLGDEPTAVDSWNEMIDELDRTWLSVAKLRYARLLSEPNSPAGRSERPDGVHLERSFAARLAATRIVPELRNLYRRSTEEMDAAGCRYLLGGRPALDAARCRAVDSITTP